MLLLVGETDGREAGEFFSSYMTTDILFSSVGLLLLIMLLQILVVVGQKSNSLLLLAIKWMLCIEYLLGCNLS